MGYDLRITRAQEFYSTTPQHEIPEAEWLAVVDADPELSVATLSDPYYFPGMVLWVTRHSDRYGVPWFAWVAGCIYSKNPNGPIIEKMIDLAERLGARVLGEAGEQYLSDGRVLGWERTPFEKADWRTR